MASANLNYTTVLTANAYTLFGATGLAEQVAKLPAMGAS
jgi:hypothetical protein